MIGPILRHEIEQTFQVVRDKSTSEELVFLCPECDDKSGHRSVNLKTGLTFCWRCNKGQNNQGWFPAWARALGFEFSQDAETSFVPLKSLLNPSRPPAKRVVPIVQEISLPRGFTPIARDPNSIYTKLITIMARRKNLDFQDFTDVGVGYTMDDPRWEAYAIFPIKEYGVNVYYQGRTYDDVPGETTKLFPSRKDVKYGPSYWVYNIDEVREKKPPTVVVVESILNVLSLKRKFNDLGVKKLVPVCVFKHHISEVQILKLLRCGGVKEFCLLFDYDAIKQMWRMVPTFSNRVRVTIAEMPHQAENPKLDANDDVDAAIVALENRKRYTTTSALKQRILS